MRPLVDIGGLGDKKIHWNEPKKLSRTMTQKEAYDYIIQGWMRFLPKDKAMELIDNLNQSYSFFGVIQSLAVIEWMIGLQKEEQNEYNQKMYSTRDTVNEAMKNYTVRYGGSGNTSGFEIVESETKVKSAIIWAFAKKWNTEISVRNTQNNNTTKIDLSDILHTIFWTVFIQKIQSLQGVSNKLSLHVDVVYEEIDDLLLSTEERNNLINEALYWMLDAFGKITMTPTS